MEDEVVDLNVEFRSRCPCRSGCIRSEFKLPHVGDRQPPPLATTSATVDTFSHFEGDRGVP